MSNLPFVEEILADLRRFKECVEDGQDVDLGRDRFDLLTQLGLLERTQRSPALWVMTQAGEDAIAQPATAEPAPIGYANPKHLARMAAGGMGSVSVLAERSPDENHTAPVFAAPPAAAHGDEAVLWVECSERLPESGCPVLAFYTNRAGMGRRIRANYVASKSHEVDCADPDTQCVEYDEEADCFYLQAGWYELIDNWEEYSSIAVIEGEVTHWMPFPAQPAMRAQGDGGEA